MKRNVIKMTILCLFMSLFAFNIQASPKGRVTVSFPIVECEFELYKVATIVNDQVVLDKDFKGLNVNIDVTSADSLNAASNVLDGYVKSNHIQYDAINKVNQELNVTFNDLNEGIYLILGNMIKDNDMMYTIMPMLVVVPYTNTNHDMIYDIEMIAKYESVPYEPDKKIDIEVLKVWNDLGCEDQRPKEIKVQLLCDDYIYDEVILNINNNWSYTWSNLENHHVYNVVEVGLNEYRKEIEKNQNLIILKNSMSGSGGDIPQTGQQWILALVLGVLGIVLVGLGVLVGKRENTYE